MPDGMIGIGPVGMNVALVERRHGEDVAEANARLIAQAPELLAAAAAVIDEAYRLGKPSKDAFDILESAVAAATWTA